MITNNIIVEGLDPIILNQQIKYNQRFNVSLSKFVIGQLIKGLTTPEDELCPEEFNMLSKIIDAFYFDNQPGLVLFENLKKIELDFLMNGLKVRVNRLEEEFLRGVNIINIQEFITLGIVLRSLECVSRGVLRNNLEGDS